MATTRLLQLMNLKKLIIDFAKWRIRAEFSHWTINSANQFVVSLKQQTDWQAVPVCRSNDGLHLQILEPRHRDGSTRYTRNCPCGRDLKNRILDFPESTRRCPRLDWDKAESARLRNRVEIEQSRLLRASSLPSSFLLSTSLMSYQLVPISAQQPQLQNTLHNGLRPRDRHQHGQQQHCDRAGVMIVVHPAIFGQLASAFPYLVLFITFSVFIITGLVY